MPDKWTREARKSKCLQNAEVWTYIQKEEEEKHCVA